LVTGFPEFAAGDDVDIAVDRLYNLLWIRVNGGNWNNDPTANITAGPVGNVSKEVSIESYTDAAYIYPMYSPYYESPNADQMTINTVPPYALPTGFTFLTADTFSGGSLTTVEGNVDVGGDLNVTTGTIYGRLSGNVLATTISASGNITGGNILATTRANASNFTGTTMSLTGSITGSNITAVSSVSAVSYVGTTVSVSGNVTGGNIRTVGLITATGNLIAGNISTAGNVNGANISVTGNVNGANISVTGNVNGANISVTGNIRGSVLTANGSSSLTAFKTPNIVEVDTISATAATGTINYDVTTQSVLYYTSNASGNWTVNFRGSSGTSLNTLMQTGESLSATFLVTQGSTAYYNSAVTIDGVSVTPKWQGGVAPTSGNINSIDSYTYVIQKTGSATYVVLASITQFA
jgi:hypothetical protein